ncbi:hypothetical protein DPMN_065305 [Dreissena polymorpha]|uniref:Uncharacterized protein n=1 Tax=Dreissena polymorpha TaxID=45954 RepID=A0A9D4CET0_DREPO|nr:hypothetical protein DPMN_065305 [Dreissena polymorpha]
MAKPSITENKNIINKSGRSLLDWIRLATVFSLRCSFTVTDAASLTVAPYRAHVGAHPNVTDNFANCR